MIFTTNSTYIFVSSYRNINSTERRGWVNSVNIYITRSNEYRTWSRRDWLARASRATPRATTRAERKRERDRVTRESDTRTRWAAGGFRSISGPSALHRPRINLTPTLLHDLSTGGAGRTGEKPKRYDFSCFSCIKNANSPLFLSVDPSYKAYVGRLKRIIICTGITIIFSYSAFSTYVC